MKIICSDGPKMGNTESLYKLYQAGMDIIRFNFSHADYNNTGQLIKFARENCPDLKVLQDLQGVKLRVGKEYRRQTKVISGETVYFCSEEYYDKTCHNKIIPVAVDSGFHSIISAKIIRMKDATMEFKVDGVRGDVISTTCVKGGIVRARKGINAPGMDRSNLDLTEKDKQDLLWGLEHGVDIVCLSFVCNAKQILRMKKFIRESDFNMPKIWAKVETKEGVENLRDIILVSDGVMLGRGDLAGELGRENVPQWQENFLSTIEETDFGGDVIIATRVLESLIRGNSPMEREISDVRFCMNHGATGFMLTAETGIGLNPELAVKTLRKEIYPSRGGMELINVDTVTDPPLFSC